MRIHLDPSNLDHYRMFLRIKSLPQYRFIGRTAEFPDEYADRVGQIERPAAPTAPYIPLPGLFDYQRDITRLAIEKQKFALFEDCGLGKGLRPECPVLTPDGFRPLASLAVGDHVIGSDGKTTKIVGYFPRGIQEFYRVTFSDGVSIECDADHLWNVKSFNDVARDKDWRTMATKDIAETQLKYGTHGQSRTWQIPLVKPVHYSPRALPLSPYVLGVLLGDGSFSTSITWSKPDREVADRVAAELPAGCRVTEHPSETRTTVWRIAAGYGLNAVHDSLKAFGLSGKRSWEKFVPADYLLGSVSDRIALLQGLMDTDGYAGESPEFCSTSRPLADAVVQLVESLGGTATLAVKPEPSYMTSGGERRVCREAYRVVMTLPPGTYPFHLSRKRNAYKAATRGLGRWIDSVVPIGKGESVCIKVDALDGLFVIDRHIVTHNTLQILEYARHVASVLPPGRCVLIVSPLMVVTQTLAEAERFYGDTLPIERVASKNLTSWLTSGTSRIGITNYDALSDDTPQGRLGALILDESSMLKSQYGKWGTTCIRLGKGLDWKLCATGTPAPNDRIEYANHAVFLDHYPTVNSFLARFFVNRGQTDNRWELKPHALRPFYRALSHWCIFLTNPGTYGWKDNCGTLPPINVHIHQVPLTDVQQGLAFEQTGSLFAHQAAGGITSRSVLSQIAKGSHRGKDIETRKPAYIRGLVDSFGQESTIIWCHFNAEQDLMEKAFPDAASISGSTPINEREDLVALFKAGRRRVLISKPKVLGFGLNLQIATRHVFSGLQDSYESYYQAVKRSNRYGSTKPLNVHIPITDIERPMIETVLSKAKRVQSDTEEQEALFRESGMIRFKRSA